MLITWFSTLLVAAFLIILVCAGVTFAACWFVEHNKQRASSKHLNRMLSVRGFN